ncbi:UNVERIFIED_CONTAM: hypothetical protein RMT77_002925 [Armadillidium vulgare]
MGSNSDFTISAMLDKIMEDEEKKSKRKQKDIESKKKKENHGNNKEQINSIPSYYGPPMVRLFPTYPNHSETHLKQVHPMSANINPPHPLPSNGSVPPQFNPSYSRPPPMPVHEMPGSNSNVVSNNSYPSNTVIPPCEFFPPPINHNPEIYGVNHHNLISNPHQNFQTFSEQNTNLPFPIEPSNLSNFSTPYNNRNSDIENESYDHKGKKAKTNSLSHFSIAATLPPPPSPPKLGTYNNSKGATPSYSVHSPKRPYTPPNCPTREFTPKRNFNSETKSSKIPRSPKHSVVEKPTHQSSYKRRKSSEPSFKPYERKIYDERKLSRYDRRDRRENSYERKSKSEKDGRERKHHTESSYRYEKYGHSRDQKRSRSREADHRSVNKFKQRQSFNEPISEEEPPFNSSCPQPSFNSFNECPPFNPMIPSPFNPVKQETSYPVVEGMPFPPPGLNFTPVKNDAHFNSDLRPFDPPPPLKILPFNPAQRPHPFNPIQEEPLNIIPAHPPFNVNELPFIPVESQQFNDNLKDFSKENNHSHLKIDSTQKSSKSSRSHKYDKRKRKHYTDFEGGAESEDEGGKRLKRKRKKEEKKESKLSKDYELEPGECISDSFSDNDSTSSSDDDSESVVSSSSSSDTEDSLYKLDFLKNKKLKTTRFDISDKEVPEESTVVKSVEKPKFPRYFKDRVAYCDDTSATNIDEPNEEFPLEEKSETPLSKAEEPKMPVSPSLVSESLKATKTPLIKRLGLSQKGEEFTKDENDYDTFTDEANLMVHTEQENTEDCQPSSVKENVANACVSGDISPFTFEQYMQRSNSLSPNNSLDFEEYRLLVSTKEILSASKSIFKSPTSPKSTTTKKKYEKPIIKVETASKPTNYKEVKESPQRIDLDSRIRLMFGMKSSCDNSPEKKNFRNAAFSYKSMRLLSRPPSPFRNRSAYQFWHRETYYFRKNNPIPDIFSDPTQKRKFGTQSKSSKVKIPKFLNLKEDYYQSREIEPRQPTKREKTENTKENKETHFVDESSIDIGDNDQLNNNPMGSNDVNQEQQQTIKNDYKEEKTSSKPNKIDLDLLGNITKVNVSPDIELEFVSQNYEDRVESNKLNILDEKYDRDSDNVVKVILNRIVEELKNEIKNKLTEEIIEETIQIGEEDSRESEDAKDISERDEKEHREKSREKDLNENQSNDEFLCFKKPQEKS